MLFCFFTWHRILCCCQVLILYSSWLSALSVDPSVSCYGKYFRDDRLLVAMRYFFLLLPTNTILLPTIQPSFTRDIVSFLFVTLALLYPYCSCHCPFNSCVVTLVVFLYYDLMWDKEASRFCRPWYKSYAVPLLRPLLSCESCLLLNVPWCVSSLLYSY